MPDGSNLDAHQIDTSDPSAHAVEFSKTAAPSREGDSFSEGAPGRGARGWTDEYSAVSRRHQPRRARSPTGRGSVARPPPESSARAPSPGQAPTAARSGPEPAGPATRRGTPEPVGTRPGRRHRAHGDGGVATGRRRS